MITRTRSPKSSPKPETQNPEDPEDPESPIPTTPEPEQFFAKPEVSARSPRMVCAVGFSGLYAILNCILWVMFNNINIWCGVHHSGLRKSAELLKFFGDLLLGGCCDILFHHMLLIDE